MQQLQIWAREGEPRKLNHRTRADGKLCCVRCLAMEDAFVIATLMKEAGLGKTATGSMPQPTSSQLKKVVEDYQVQRGKRVGDTVIRARKRAAITHALEGFQQTNEWYAELAHEDGKNIMNGMSKTILGAPKELDKHNRVEPVIASNKDSLLIQVADGA